LENEVGILLSPKTMSTPLLQHLLTKASLRLRQFGYTFYLQAYSTSTFPATVNVPNSLSASGTQLKVFL